MTTFWAAFETLVQLLIPSSGHTVPRVGKHIFRTLQTRFFGGYDDIIQSQYAPFGSEIERSFLVRYEGTLSDL